MPADLARGAPARGRSTASLRVGLASAARATPDGTLVEFVELPREAHPYYVATQAHPELKSRPTRSHPLFRGLIEAALQRQLELRLPVETDAS